MKRFVAGADRAQSTLLPESLDDWVDESNRVRVIDAFVDALNVGDLGFEGVERFPSCYISAPLPGFILTLALFDPTETKWLFGIKRLRCATHRVRLKDRAQDSRPAGWLASTGRESNPLDRGLSQSRLAQAIHMQFLHPLVAERCLLEKCK